MHTWTTEVVDGGPVGDADFWVCRTCGANGGCRDWGDPHPFLGGPGLSLTDECRTSEILMADYIGVAIRQMRDDEVKYAEAYVDLLKRASFTIPARPTAMRVLAGIAFDMTFSTDEIDVFEKRLVQAGWPSVMVRPR